MASYIDRDLHAAMVQANRASLPGWSKGIDAQNQAWARVSQGVAQRQQNAQRMAELEAQNEAKRAERDRINYEVLQQAAANRVLAGQPVEDLGEFITKAGYNPSDQQAQAAVYRGQGLGQSAIANRAYQAEVARKRHEYEMAERQFGRDTTFGGIDLRNRNKGVAAVQKEAVRKEEKAQKQANIERKESQLVPSQLASFKEGFGAIDSVFAYADMAIKNPEAFGPLSARVEGAKALTGEGVGITTQGAHISAAQNVGRYLEGGKLTDPDFQRYAVVIPPSTRTEKQVIASSQAVIMDVITKMESELKLLAGQGKDTTKIAEQLNEYKNRAAQLDRYISQTQQAAPVRQTTPQPTPIVEPVPSGAVPPMLQRPTNTITLPPR